MTRLRVPWLVTTASGETNRLDSAPRPWPSRVTQLADRCSILSSVSVSRYGHPHGKAPARGCGRWALSRHPWPMRFGRHGARKKKQTMSQLRGPDKGVAAGLLGWDTWMPRAGQKRGLTDDACQPGYPHFGWWHQAVGCWESPASSPWHQVPGRASGKRAGGNCSHHRGARLAAAYAYGARHSPSLQTGRY